MFRAVLFIVVNRQKQPKGPGTAEWALSTVYTMECYSVSKSNEIMIYVATWVNLKTLC